MDNLKVDPNYQASTPFTRMLREYSQLDTKTRLLEAFIRGPEFPLLEPEETRTDLSEQLAHMTAYKAVLQRRIKRMGNL